MTKIIFKIENLIWAMMCIVSIFTYTHQMTDTYIVPKWCFTLLVLLFGVLIISTKRLFGGTTKVNVTFVSYIVITVCFMQALYALGQWAWMPTSQSHTMGSFENPAGLASCLCFSLPFAIICWQQTRAKMPRISICLMILSIVTVLILSKSRTGIFSLIIISILYLYKHLHCKTIYKVTTVSAFLIVSLTMLYLIRKDSADGRLLIWKCSWEMIKDAPFFGSGMGAFRAHYMDYQAYFFKNHIDSKYAMLADNVTSPFNEYISITIQFGLIGLLTLLSFFLWLFLCNYKTLNTEKRIALLSLSSIGSFSLFSYPFTYPFTWLIAGLDVFILSHDHFRWTLSIPCKKALYGFISICCIVVIYNLSLRINAEYEWKKLIYKYPTENTISRYTILLPIMGENPYFLYNYAITLMNAGHINKSQEKAQQCSLYWADYDLEILQGNIAKSLGKPNEAETHYKKAALMCPCRIIPYFYYLTHI